MQLRTKTGMNFKRRGKMVRKANHGTRPTRRNRRIRMGRGGG